MLGDAFCNLVEYCPTNDQTNDIFTKPIKRIQFLILRRELGVMAFEIKKTC